MSMFLFRMAGSWCFARILRPTDLWRSVDSCSCRIRHSGTGEEGPRHRGNPPAVQNRCPRVVRDPQRLAFLTAPAKGLYSSRLLYLWPGESDTRRTKTV